MAQTDVPKSRERKLATRGGAMQNAHERFGTLEFTKRVKDTTTRVRVYVDRIVLEPSKVERGQALAHLVSVIGADAEIAALWAALTDAALFDIQLPGRTRIAASLGLEAQCFRGSLAVVDRKRPARHLVAISAELAKTKPGADREGTRTILCEDDPIFVLYRIANRYGLPVVPAWAPWFMHELNRRKAIRPLTGLGCSPVLIYGNKSSFLKWIGKALKDGLIHIPKENSSITWPLPTNFLERSPEAAEGSCIPVPVR
jgi:hypothetical protein